MKGFRLQRNVVAIALVGIIGFVLAVHFEIDWKPWQGYVITGGVFSFIIYKMFRK